MARQGAQQPCFCDDGRVVTEHRRRGPTVDGQWRERRGPIAVHVELRVPRPAPSSGRCLNTLAATRYDAMRCCTEMSWVAADVSRLLAAASTAAGSSGCEGFVPEADDDDEGAAPGRVAAAAVAGDAFGTRLAMSRPLCAGPVSRSPSSTLAPTSRMRCQRCGLTANAATVSRAKTTYARREPEVITATPNTKPDATNQRRRRKATGGASRAKSQSAHPLRRYDARI